jgi:hypothetical protein
MLPASLLDVFRAGLSALEISAGGKAAGVSGKTSPGGISPATQARVRELPLFKKYIDAITKKGYFAKVEEGTSSRRSRASFVESSRPVSSIGICCSDLLSTPAPSSHRYDELPNLLSESAPADIRSGAEGSRSRGRCRRTRTSFLL